MKNEFTNGLIELTKYLFCLKDNERDYMVSANELEKKLLIELVHGGKTIKETVQIAREFNTEYKKENNKDYLLHLNGETLFLEAEKYNIQKAISFEAWLYEKGYLKVANKIDNKPKI